MYRLTRVLLIIAVIEVIACIILITLVWWPWPALVLAFVAATRFRRCQDMWSHGTARWAHAWELRRGGMVGSTKGLMIGRLIETGKRPPFESIQPLFDPRVSSKQACEQHLLRFGPRLIRESHGELVRLQKTPHTLICAPTGMAKGASFIIPHLMNSDESAVVLDFKGENAHRTAELRRRKFHHHVVLLDPWHVVTNQPDCLNPLDFIDANQPDWLDSCRDLAELLVTRKAELEPHWNDGSEMFIGGTLAAVTRKTDYADRSLQTVRDILSNPANIPRLIELLSESEGLLPRLGGQLAAFRDRELASTLTTTNRHLRFLDTPLVAASTRASSFSPSELRHGKMTVYCIIPPEHARVQSSLLRMWIGTLMRAVMRDGVHHA